MQSARAVGPVPGVCVPGLSSSAWPKQTRAPGEANPGCFSAISQDCPRALLAQPALGTAHTVVSLPALRLGAENWRLMRGGVTNWFWWLGRSVCFGGVPSALPWP